MSETTSLRLGTFRDHEVVEGTPASRRAAFDRRVREARLAAARAHRVWREYTPEELTPRKFMRQTLYANPDGHLLAPVRHDVIQTHRMEDGQTVGATVWNEGAACAFFVTEAGDVVVLEPAHIRSGVELDLIERRQAWKRSDAELAEREFQRAQPLRPVTLADLEGRELPTIGEAAQAVLDARGTIEAHDGRLVVKLPERFAPDRRADEKARRQALDAVRVLVAAGPLVVAAVESRSTKPLAHRLPDAHVLAAGGFAP